MTPTTLSGALRFLVDVEQEVNIDRPQDMRGGKDPMRTYLFAMIVELSELAQEVDWKPWKGDKQIDPARVADEYADILAFLGVITANIMEQTGLTTDQLADAFTQKTLINIARAQGKIPGYTPEGGTAV